MNALAHAKEEVAKGSRILAAQSILDAFGHLSCRNPESPDRFLISRNLAPAMVGTGDVVDLDLDGNQAGDAERARLFLERYIHGEIYRRRPDVHAIVHSHATPVLPFTLVPGVRLKPICHMCGFLDGTPETFDVADHAGPASDLLISTRELGRDLAEHLGPANITLMRAHGFTVVGNSVAQAVYRAVYTMRNCEIELSARLLGTPRYLALEEAQACERTTGAQADRAWNLWVHQLARAEAGATAAAA